MAGQNSGGEMATPRENHCTGQRHGVVAAPTSFRILTAISWQR